MNTKTLALLLALITSLSLYYTQTSDKNDLFEQWKA